MANLYPVHFFTAADWDNYSEQAEEFPHDTIDVVLKNGAICMDIEAEGERIVPILRKIERSLKAVGLVSDDKPAPYNGWFDEWANSLTDPREKKYFLWKYDGKNDAENGHWSYSWEIEELTEGLWYIFLNIAV